MLVVLSKIKTEHRANKSEKGTLQRVKHVSSILELPDSKFKKNGGNFVDYDTRLRAIVTIKRMCGLD